METLLGEEDRARSIFEIAVKQPALDMPEVSNILLIYFCLDFMEVVY